MSEFGKQNESHGTIQTNEIESRSSNVEYNEKLFMFEPFFPEKHDKNKIAELIFKSDEQLNLLVYGRDPLKVILKLLNMKESYFVPNYTKCVHVNNELAGVVTYYSSDLSKRKQVDKIAGQGFMKAMGIISFIQKMPLYIKMDKMLGGVIDDGGLYIHTICVDETFRGCGIGSRIIKELEKENTKMYLYVNAANKGAIHFYEKNGFEKKFLGTMNYNHKDYAEYLMEKNS
jgi:ribosomal protein S18 acetylase RimI-like enzyme